MFFVYIFLHILFGTGMKSPKSGSLNIFKDPPEFNLRDDCRWKELMHRDNR